MKQLIICNSYLPCHEFVTQILKKTGGNKYGNNWS